MQQAYLIGMVAALVLVVGPLLFGFAGWLHARRAPAVATVGLPARWNWRLSVASTLLYTLAFNLTFFLQELFLVLPKALTPGLRPTLFHNNHSWEGENPLAGLFQGTGAVAILLSGLLCALLVKHGVGRSKTTRLFLVWMAYCGCFMALPQVVIGALSSGSDLGMAMAYLQLGATAKTMMALVALAAILPIALRLGHSLLELADDKARVASTRARNRFVFQVATLPALVAIVLILPFRLPRELVEVVMVPLVVTLVGIAWIQAAAWRMPEVEVDGPRNVSIAWPLGAVVLLLLAFQLVLRPGIRFY